MTEERYVKLVIDATTGTQEEIDLTPEEITEIKAMQLNFQVRQEEEKAAEETKAALKASAKAKLIAGQPLTEEEAATIVI
jgi:hypothetical protein